MTSEYEEWNEILNLYDKDILNVIDNITFHNDLRREGTTFDATLYGDKISGVVVKTESAEIGTPSSPLIITKFNIKLNDGRDMQIMLEGNKMVRCSIESKRIRM